MCLYRHVEKKLHICYLLATGKAFVAQTGNVSLRTAARPVTPDDARYFDGLVSTTASLTSRSTRSAKLPFFQKAPTLDLACPQATRRFYLTAVEKNPRLARIKDCKKGGMHQKN